MSKKISKHFYLIYSSNIATVSKVDGNALPFASILAIVSAVDSHSAMHAYKRLNGALIVREELTNLKVVEVKLPYRRMSAPF